MDDLDDYLYGNNAEEETSAEDIPESHPAASTDAPALPSQPVIGAAELSSSAGKDEDALSEEDEENDDDSSEDDDLEIVLEGGDQASGLLGAVIPNMAAAKSAERTGMQLKTVAEGLDADGNPKDGSGAGGQMDEVIPIFAEGVNINGIGDYQGQSILDVDMEDEEKMWRKPGADITDFFNYGFTEQTWRDYCLKQRRMREALGLSTKRGYDREHMDGGDRRAEDRPRPKPQYGNRPEDEQSFASSGFDQDRFHSGGGHRGGRGRDDGRRGRGSGHRGGDSRGHDNPHSPYPPGPNHPPHYSHHRGCTDMKQGWLDDRVDHDSRVPSRGSDRRDEGGDRRDKRRRDSSVDSFGREKRGRNSGRY